MRGKPGMRRRLVIGVVVMVLAIVAAFSAHEALVLVGRGDGGLADFAQGTCGHCHAQM